MANPAGLEIEVDLPWRELIDADPDRGIALYDDRLRLAFANAAARTFLHEPTGPSTLALLEVMQALRARSDRTDGGFQPREVLLGTDGQRLRATVSSLNHDNRRYILVRLTPPAPVMEPTLRTLSSRFLLTQREAEVALAVAKGLTNAETATRLGITEKTVKNSLMVIFGKVGVRSRVELALVAHEARFERP